MKTSAEFRKMPESVGPNNAGDGAYSRKLKLHSNSNKTKKEKEETKLKSK